MLLRKKWLFLIDNLTSIFIASFSMSELFYKFVHKCIWLGQLLNQGLDWDWSGTGLELDRSNLANTSRLMQARAYSDEM